MPAPPISIFLGIQAWRAPVADLAPIAASPRETASRWSLYRGGFLVGISNPKLLVFAAAFFPQFIARDAPWAPQFLLLVATFLAVEACTYVTLGLSARGLARYLEQARLAAPNQPAERRDFRRLRLRTASLPAVTLPASLPGV